MNSTTIILVTIILIVTIAGLLILKNNKFGHFQKNVKIYLSLDRERKLNKFPPIEKFKNLDEPSKCIKTPYSKEYAKKILESLETDINKVHPIDEYHLSFHPLECCTLEDSATEDKKKVFICVKDKNGNYYNYNKLLQVALHELAHAQSKAVDPNHTSKEFLTNYNNLMSKASKMGIIDLSKLNITH